MMESLKKQVVNRLKSPEIPRKMVMTVSGVKSNTFPMTLSTMKKKGLILYNKDSIWSTEAGHLKACPDAIQDCIDNETTQEDIIKRFMIGGKALLLFNAMRDGKNSTPYPFSSYSG
jgi:hypothetical protein